MSDITAIAFSGGIDSLTAAYLLKEQGHRLFGIYFVTGYEFRDPHEIKALGDQIGIRIEPLDCRRIFQSQVVDYFIQTYKAGQTPNPCLVCNPCIKFGAVFDAARKMGASRLATGHYARVSQGRNGRFRLLRGTDQQKDQSYFLALLSQEQLSAAVFPLGDMTKSEVRMLAAEKGLCPVAKKESQDVCFIREGNYADFLACHGLVSTPGTIEDTEGRRLGMHQGLHLFTVGQRRGINCPASEPYYVVSMDVAQNRLRVGFKKDLLSFGCRVTGINWIGREPEEPISVFARLRYRHKAAASELFPIDRRTAAVRFEEPQAAVTPGQGAVFYDGDEVLGGGWIEKNDLTKTLTGLHLVQKV